MMAMTAASSSHAVATKPTISAAGFVITPADTRLMSLTERLQLYCQSGSGLTISMAMQLDASTFDGLTSLNQL